MDSSEIIPHFEYDNSMSRRKNCVCIVADDIVFQRISNLDEFYRALGYADDIRATGMLPAEFIWDRYTRDNAAKSAQCLQSKIMGYLNNHSETFRKKYGGEYANMIGKCISDKIDDSDLCVDCLMHPRFLN